MIISFNLPTFNDVRYTIILIILIILLISFHFPKSMVTSTSWAMQYKKDGKRWSCNAWELSPSYLNCSLLILLSDFSLCFPPNPSKEQQRCLQKMSVWEQRTSQLRRHNLRNSNEALYNELEPEDRLRMSSALHLRPDIMAHHDRPLLVDKSHPPEGRNTPEEAPPHKHHRCHGENGEAGEGRRHRHHRSNEQKGHQDGGRRNQTEDGDDDREHRHHHSHRPRETDGDGSYGVNGDRNLRGHREGEAGNEEKRRNRPRIKAQTTLEKDESWDIKERETPSHRSATVIAFFL